MREILFRGKAECDNKWYIGWYIPPYEYKWSGQDDTGRSKAVIEFVRDDLRPDFVPVKEATAGQYTGLTDKNGTKIFEGDIVRAVLPKSNAISEFVWPNMVVGFSKGAFTAMRGRYCTPLYSFAPAVELEVIGNIYDNPELMEDK